MGAIKASINNEVQDGESLDALLADLYLGEDEAMEEAGADDIVIAAEPFDNELEIAVALAEGSETASPFAVTDAVPNIVVTTEKPLRKPVLKRKLKKKQNQLYANITPTKKIIGDRPRLIYNLLYKSVS